MIKLFFQNKQGKDYGYCHTRSEVRPAAIYSKKYQRWGTAAFCDRVPKTKKGKLREEILNATLLSNTNTQSVPAEGSETQG